MDSSAVERGKKVAHERLSARVDPVGSSGNWTTVALKSEIETLELINSSRDQELHILKQQLIESNKLLKTARKHIEEMKDSQKASGRSSSGANENAWTINQLPCPKGSFPSNTLLDSFSSCNPTTLRHVCNHLERVLGIADVNQVGKALDRLAAAETKYMELVKAVCIRDRVDMNRVSHPQIVKSLKTGEPIPSMNFKDEVQKPRGVAWTFQ
jgi:hypothetical protein